MLHSSRICLRAAEPEDLDLMYLVENDTELWACGGTTVPYSRFVLRQFIEESRNDIRFDGQLRLVIEEAESRQGIGFVDLQNYDAQHNRAEVGIVLVPAFQGRGLASESLAMLSAYAAERLRLGLLYAYVSTENRPAEKLFLQAGFARSGLLPRWINSSQDAIVFTKLL